MTKQEKLRETIRELVIKTQRVTTLFFEGSTGSIKFDYSVDEITNQIMSILVERCTILDDRKLGFLLGIPSGFPTSLTYEEVEQNQRKALIQAGWRPVLLIERR